MFGTEIAWGYSGTIFEKSEKKRFSIRKFILIENQTFPNISEIQPSFGYVS